MKSLQQTAQVYTELNQAILAQYPFGQKPKVKADYWQTYQGKANQTIFKPMSDYLFKEYWERIMQAETGIRGDILLFENPAKIPLFNILLDLLSDTIVLLESEKNQYTEYIKDNASELLRWLKTRLPKGNLAIKDEVRKDYYNQLNQYFEPKEQFRNFVYGKEFSVINFKGTQAQLAGIFKQINKNADLIKTSWGDVSKYIYENFTINGKKVKIKTIMDYLTGKKKIAEKNLIEIKI